MHKCQKNMVSQGTITKANGEFWDLKLCRNKAYNKSPKTSWKVSLLYCACPFSFLVYNQEPYNPTFLAVISLLSFLISFFFFFLLLCITLQNNPVTFWPSQTTSSVIFFLSYLLQPSFLQHLLCLSSRCTCVCVGKNSDRLLHIVLKSSLDCHEK